MKVGVYAKYHGFDSVLELEPYLGVGGSTSKDEFMRLGISTPVPRRRTPAVQAVSIVQYSTLSHSHY